MIKPSLINYTEVSVVEAARAIGVEDGHLRVFELAGNVLAALGDRTFDVVLPRSRRQVQHVFSRLCAHRECYLGQRSSLAFVLTGTH